MAQRLTTVCGSTIFVKIKSNGKRKKGEKRKRKENPTAEKVMQINQKNAERDLAMILNHNFRPSDLHLVLTYKNIPNNDEAHKALDKFIRKCRAFMKKAGKIFKAVMATEYEHKRLHHHIVCSAMDLDIITKFWEYGFVKCSVLDESGDYRRLAAYLIKETSKTFREAGAFSKRRYNCTRSIEKPITKSEQVSDYALLHNPRSLKGYYIDQDSIYRGENAFDGKPYMEYVMVSLDAENPRLKTWKKGKKSKTENKYNGWLKKHLSQQLNIDLYSLDI